jgi:hypothetical protein
LMKAPVARSVGHHDVSKPKAAVASWNAERIGPTIIAVPHRGHASPSVDLPESNGAGGVGSGAGCF